MTAICSLLIPVATEFHYGAMIALRSIQGAASVSKFIPYSLSSNTDQCESHLLILYQPWPQMIFASITAVSFDSTTFSVSFEYIRIINSVIDPVAPLRLVKLI